MTREKLSSILLANTDLIYCVVRTSSKRELDGMKGMDEGHRYFSHLRASLYLHFEKNHFKSTFLVYNMLYMWVNNFKIRCYFFNDLKRNLSHIKEMLGVVSLLHLCGSPNPSFYFNFENHSGNCYLSGF